MLVSVEQADSKTDEFQSTHQAVTFFQNDEKAFPEQKN